jgi:hypothetical protein
MTPLRAKYIRDLVIRGRSKHTQEAGAPSRVAILALWQMSAYIDGFWDANTDH